MSNTNFEPKIIKSRVHKNLNIELSDEEVSHMNNKLSEIEQSTKKLEDSTVNILKRVKSINRLKGRIESSLKV